MKTVLVLTDRTNNNPNHKEEDVVELLDDISANEQLIVYNDDVNTFQHVIECLMRICHHTAEQAEQSSIIIHFKGKSIVKTGVHSELAAMCRALCDEGLSASLGE
jgi:ATP-dependent Clp protease adaptor protein ClpS